MNGVLRGFNLGPRTALRGFATFLAVPRSTSMPTAPNGLVLNLAAGALPFLVLVFCLSLAALVFSGSTHAQDDESLPLVSLESLSPSPVKEGTKLTIVARITPPLPAGTSTVIKSGVRIFDSSDSPPVSQLLALAFRGGSRDTHMAVHGARRRCGHDGSDNLCRHSCRLG